MKPRLRATLMFLTLSWGAVACSGPVRTERTFEALGRPVRVDLFTATERGADQLVDELRLAMERADRELGAGPDAELARLNATATTTNYAVQGRDLFGCIKLALDWARASEGAYDPVAGGGFRQVRVFDEAMALRLQTPEARIRLDGIYEGCVLDVSTRNFARAGTRAGLVAFGSVQYAWMPPPGRESWEVTVHDGERPERAVARVTFVNRAVGVAGTLAPDPERAASAPADTVLGAAAIADTAADAQVIATALSRMGARRAGALLERTRRTEALLLVRSVAGVELLVSASLRDRIEIDPSFEQSVAAPPRFILPPLEFP